MDTQWFAVDLDDNVGVFNSWEAGAVPDGAFAEEGDLLEHWAAEAGDRPIPLDGSAILADLGAPAFDDLCEELMALYLREVPPPQYRMLVSALLRLAPGATWPDDIQPALRFEGDPPVIYIREGPRSMLILTELLDLVAEGVVTGGSLGLDDDSPYLGVFTFEHGQPFENWISGPYERLHTPRERLRLEHLPPRLRRAIGRVRLGVHFDDAQRIQPAAHGSCHSWQQEWVDLDGKHHPFPR